MVVEKPLQYLLYSQKKTTISGGFLGADSGIRTRDLVLTKDVLYLLSHISLQLLSKILNERTIHFESFNIIRKTSQHVNSFLKTTPYN